MDPTKNISTKEMTEELKKALERPTSENYKRYAPFGRIFLLRMIMGKKDPLLMNGTNAPKLGIVPVCG